MLGLGHLGRLGSQGGGGFPSWLPIAAGAAPTLFADFTSEGTTNRYWFSGKQYGSFAAWNTAVGGTFTRASTATYLSGGLVATALSGVPRFPSTGIRLTGAQTELTLWNRDLTNAAWVKTTMTAAKDQTGADGTATSASSLLATAGNATALQAITSGSAARITGAYVKRITGTGEIDITQDNGVTWTPIAITAAYVFYSLPSATLANPTVGFRIVTNGDKIAVDFVSQRTDAGGTFIADVIPTTTVAVTQAGDTLFIPTAPWLSLVGGTLASSGAAMLGQLEISLAFNNAGSYGAGNGLLHRLGNGGNNAAETGGNATNVTITTGSSGSAFKFASIYNVPTTLQRVVDVNGANNENSTCDFTGVATSRLQVGALDSLATQQLFGSLKSLAYFPVAASVAQAVSALGRFP